MNNLRPAICMKRDFDAVEFIKKRVSQAEPCSIIALPQMGINVIFDKIKQELTQKDYQFISIQASKAEELKEVLSLITKNPQKTILVVYLTSEIDFSWFIEELEGLRNKYSTDFIPVIISYLPSVAEAFKKQIKILTRSMLVLQPFNDADALVLINDFFRRFGYILTKEQLDFITKFGIGNAGIIKSFYLYFQDNPKAGLNLKEIILFPNTSTRVKSILDCFDAQAIKNWFNNHLNQVDKLYLAQFGLEELPEIFKEYILINKPEFSELTLEKLNLTKQEQVLYQYFCHNSQKIVSKKFLSNLLWGDSRNKDYALDMLIHRLRSKLDKNESLITKRGLGYIFFER